MKYILTTPNFDVEFKHKATGNPVSEQSKYGLKEVIN